MRSQSLVWKSCVSVVFFCLILVFGSACTPSKSRNPSTDLTSPKKSSLGQVAEDSSGNVSLPPDSETGSGKPEKDTSESRISVRGSPYLATEIKPQGFDCSNEHKTLELVLRQANMSTWPSFERRDKKSGQLLSSISPEKGASNFRFWIDGNITTWAGLSQPESWGSSLHDTDPKDPRGHRFELSYSERNKTAWATYSFYTPENVRANKFGKDYEVVEKYSCTRRPDHSKEVDLIRAACEGKDEERVEEEIRVLLKDENLNLNLSYFGHTFGNCLLNKKRFSLFHEVLGKYGNRLDPNVFGAWSQESWLALLAENDQVDLTKYVFTKFPAINPVGLWYQGEERRSLLSYARSPNMLSLLTSGELGLKLDLNQSVNGATLLTAVVSGLRDSTSGAKIFSNSRTLLQWLLLRKDIEVNKVGLGGLTPIEIAARDHSELYWILRKDPRVLPPRLFLPDQAKTYENLLMLKDLKEFDPRGDRKGFDEKIWIDVLGWVPQDQLESLPLEVRLKILSPVIEPARTHSWKFNSFTWPKSKTKNEEDAAVGQMLSRYFESFPLSDLEFALKEGANLSRYVRYIQHPEVRQRLGYNFSQDSRKAVIFRRYDRREVQPFSAETYAIDAILFKRDGRLIFKNCRSPIKIVTSLEHCDSAETIMTPQQIQRLELFSEPRNLVDLASADERMEVEEVPEEQVKGPYKFDQVTGGFKLKKVRLDTRLRKIKIGVSECGLDVPKEAQIPDRVQSCHSEKRGDFELLYRKRAEDTGFPIEVWWDSKRKLIWSDLYDPGFAYTPRHLQKNTQEIEQMLASGADREEAFGSPVLEYCPSEMRGFIPAKSWRLPRWAELDSAHALFSGRGWGSESLISFRKAAPICRNKECVPAVWLYSTFSRQDYRLPIETVLKEYLPQFRCVGESDFATVTN